LWAASVSSSLARTLSFELPERASRMRSVVSFSDFSKSAQRLAIESASRPRSKHVLPVLPLLLEGRRREHDRLRGREVLAADAVEVLDPA
jgi:hypothetical protein